MLLFMRRSGRAPPLWRARHHRVRWPRFYVGLRPPMPPISWFSPLPRFDVQEPAHYCYEYTYCHFHTQNTLMAAISRIKNP